VVLVAWGLVLAFRGATAPERGVAPGGVDLRMYASVTAQVAAGADYYQVLAREMPARGYATQPFLNWRLPTLVWFHASLPETGHWRAAPVVILGFGVIILWLLIVRIHAPDAATWGMPVLFMGVPALLLPAAPEMHELWAGLLIAGSIGVWSLGWRTASILLGAVALLIRELALPYVAVMGIMAWLQSSRREAVGWVLAACVFALYLAWHAAQVAPVMPKDAIATSWVTFGGWRFVLATSHVNALLHFIPGWITAVAVPLAWAGLWRWGGPLGTRLALTVTVYFALFLIAGRPDNWYWGLLIAPLLPLGLFGWFTRPRRDSSA
jgi:hypothetical protein